IEPIWIPVPIHHVSMAGSLVSTVLKESVNGKILEFGMGNPCLFFYLCVLGIDLSDEQGRGTGAGSIVFGQLSFSYRRCPDFSDCQDHGNFPKGHQKSTQEHNYCRISVPQPREWVCGLGPKICGQWICRIGNIGPTLDHPFFDADPPGKENK